MVAEAENPTFTLPTGEDSSGDVEAGCARAADAARAKAAEGHRAGAGRSASKASADGGSPSEVGLAKGGGARVLPAALVLFFHVSAVSLAMPLYCDVLLLAPRVQSRATRMDQISGAQQLLSVAIGLNAFFELMTSGLLGVLCDRIGRRPVAVLTQVGQFVDYSVAAFCAPAIYDGGHQLHRIGLFVVAARAFSGLCGNIKVPLQGYVADLSVDGAAAQNFSQLNIAMGFALVAGPALSLLVIQSSHKLRLAIGVAACLSLCNIVLICCTWTRSIPVQAASWREANPYWLLRSTIMRTRRLQIFGWMNFLDAFAITLIMSTIPLFTKIRYGWTSSTLVLYFLAIGLLTPAQMFCILRPLLKLKGEVFVLKLGYMATCVAYLLMFSIGLTGIGIAFFATTVVFTLGLISNPTQTGMAVRELPPEEYGRLSGGLSLLETLGKVLAPCVGGMLLTRGMQWECPSLVYLAAAVVMLPGVALAFTIQALSKAVFDTPQSQPEATRPARPQPPAHAAVAAAAGASPAAGADTAGASTASAEMTDPPDDSPVALPHPSSLGPRSSSLGREEHIMSI